MSDNYVSGPGVSLSHSASKLDEVRFIGSGRES